MGATPRTSTGPGLRTGAGLSTASLTDEAVTAAAAEALGGLDGAPVDLACVFFTPDHAPAALEIAEAAHDLLAPRAFLGCSAQGVIGGARERERSPGLSLWAAHLPRADLRVFLSTFERTSDDAVFYGWPQGIPEDASILLMADPFTYPTEALLRLLNQERNPVPVIGGMASGGTAPGETRIIAGHEVTNGGAAGVVISGGVRVRTVVSQGCRPIGVPAAVTRAEGNVIHELAGEPPMSLIRETFRAAPERERVQMEQGLHAGIVIDEYKEQFERGDFLIRNVIGSDAESGAIAIGEAVELGATVQFHVRDASSAGEDLRLALKAVPRPPAGALLFSCNGRGTPLFGAPDHDAQAVQSAFGGIPLAGFFCAGEIGPVGGKSFIHGFTASLALFEAGEA